jgi:hypothetical protein
MLMLGVTTQTEHHYQASHYVRIGSPRDVEERQEARTAELRWRAADLALAELLEEIFEDTEIGSQSLAMTPSV